MTQQIIRPENTRFYIKENNGKCEIFDKEQGDIKIGDYRKNHYCQQDSFNTFHPFKSKEGKWYTLYTEGEGDHSLVMSLPDCTQIAKCDTIRGNGDTSGFYPVQFYVPFVAEMDFGNGIKKYTNLEDMGPLEKEDEEHYMSHNWHHLDIGFVYGCYWAYPYEIKVLDLSKIEEGKIATSNVKPNSLPLKIMHFRDVIDVFYEHDTIRYSVNGRCYKDER